MNGPLVGGSEECRRIINAESVLLDTSVTGEHYQLSGRIHTDRAYFFQSILQWGHHRELLARELLRVALERGVDMQRDVDVLVATSMTAMQLCCTLQHFVGFQQKRLMFVEGEGDKTILGRGFSFQQDERAFLVHFAAVRFRTIRATIKAIHEFGDRTGIQPCVTGFAVLLDRSPEGFRWEMDFVSFRRVVLFREPLRLYSADRRRCTLCKKGIPLVDLRGAT